ncbi:MAG: DUF2452 domain-containing protein [Woeseiaceae bacterium]|nr:DUF2452 domain-containing protein [Woeseiaceae bacterium]
MNERMRRSKAAETGTSLVAAKNAGNPEGKGVNGFLRDWHASRPRGVVAKPRRQLLAEFFTSMLVLSAQFRFQPVVGKPYFLYWFDDQWVLSLVAPEQWADEKGACFAGTCVLQRDKTWTMTPSASLGDDNDVSRAVSRFYDAFVSKLDTDLALEEILPRHLDTLPYYQRLYASAVSRSLQAAMTLGDQTATSCREWLLLLPKRQQVLPQP